MSDVEHMIMFQSPSGVLGVCRFDEDAAYRSTFKGFQSPSGVLGVCRDSAKSPTPKRPRGTFQSPSGVLGVCRHSRASVARVSRVFQSPSGVLGVCRIIGGMLKEWLEVACFSPLPGF